jgi:hypothetical protein
MDKKTMKKTLLLIFFTTLLQSIAADNDSAMKLDINTILTTNDLNTSIRNLSESALVEESTMVKQAIVQAKSSSSFGMQVRPNVTDDSAGVGLRIYLPDRWSNKKLREQLKLVAESEQLRVEGLEWQELLTVYRYFCTYRMLQKQIALYVDELNIFKPYLTQADHSVEQHQLKIADRTDIYSTYLDIVNNKNKAELELIDIERRLYLTLGSKANLNAFSEIATITLPAKLEINALLQQAQENRTDYQLLEVNSKSLDAAGAIAHSEDGFHLKYIQPEYQVDYNEGESSYGISAAFVLPWGNRNKDVAVYKQQKIQTLSTIALQRRIMQEQLQVLVNTSYALDEQIEKGKQLTTPLLKQLESDLKQMTGGTLNQACCWMGIRERILDTKLQTTQAECEREKIAVELAKELGTFAQ